MEGFEKEWDLIRGKIKMERKQHDSIENLDKVFKNLSKDQILDIIKSIPQEDLFILLKQSNICESRVNR